MKTKFLLLIVLLLQTALALAIKVEGTVLDEMKQPVIGATVQVKGAASGTITDLNGKFTLKVDRVKEDILVVSYVGYKTKHCMAERPMNAPRQSGSRCGVRSPMRYGR